MDDEKQEKLLQVSEKLESLYLEEREIQCRSERVKKEITQFEQRLEILLGKRQPRRSAEQ